MSRFTPTSFTLHVLVPSCETSGWAVLAVAALAACARPVVREERVSIAPGHQGVLFIGNSLTFHNDLPGTVAALARSAGGPLLDVRASTIPGGTLEGAWDEGRAAALIDAARWSAVVLQEQSERPLRDPAAMERAAVRLAAPARVRGARVIVYGTWPDRRRPETERALERTFARVARAVHGTVAPAGAAWARAGQLAPQLALWAEDGVHPTPAGTYLAACVLFATLTGHSPVGLAHRTVRASTDGQTFRTVEVPAADAAVLQRVAAAEVDQTGPGSERPRDRATR